jgi:hypothetical protein
MYHVVLGHYRRARYRHVSIRKGVVAAKFESALWNTCAIHEAVLIVVGVQHVPAAQRTGLSPTRTRDGPMAALAEG